MASSRSPLATITGIALIVLPLLALGLKMFSFGWYMVMLMFGPGLVLIIGYALQLVIAIHGFLSRRSPILTTAVRGRATAAAWVTSIAVVVLEWIAGMVLRRAARRSAAAAPAGASPSNMKSLPGHTTSDSSVVLRRG